MTTLKYKDHIYDIEFGEHVGNHAKKIRKMLNDNHTLIYGKKVIWTYRPCKTIRVTYLGRASDTKSWIDEPGEYKPQKVSTKDLEVGYVEFF